MEFSRRVNRLQGPRPSALTLNTIQSVKMKKPAPPQKAAAKPPLRCPVDPVIVYLRSPTIIHVKPEEFMELVQRLTSNRPSLAPPAGASAENNNASSSSASSCMDDESCLNGARLTLATPSGLFSPNFDGFNGFCMQILDDFDK